MSAKYPFFSSIIVAGCGSVGRAFLLLAGDYLRSFPFVFPVDLKGDSMKGRSASREYRVLAGDIEDGGFLGRLLDGAPPPLLFVNLCSGVDTVRLRKSLSGLRAAYIDVGASALPPGAPSSFGDIMAYTNTAVASPYPHLLCQGLNPGMVELVARRLMRDFFDSSHPLEVVVFERDTLSADLPDRAVPVGWSPGDLLEEMVLLPAFEIRHGLPLESTTNGSLPLWGTWNDERIQARVVAHEDIWHLGLLERVENARFIYSFADTVMELIGLGRQEAEQRLMIPPEETPVRGLDTIIVTVRDLVSGRSQSRAWSVDHFDIWRQYGLNGVQYQTANFPAPLPALSAKGRAPRGGGDLQLRYNAPRPGCLGPLRLPSRGVGDTMAPRERGRPAGVRVDSERTTAWRDRASLAPSSPGGLRVWGHSSAALLSEGCPQVLSPANAVQMASTPAMIKVKAFLLRQWFALLLLSVSVHAPPHNDPPGYKVLYNLIII